ncbi:SIR2 family NAD-dependent protein deacylase [Nonlabens ponticola]|uniref:NAD-dependent protein deacylase n=1 Tax=Nonlabens ponticola TaxID=2496866 RepID=A0A3S9MYB9_9FLAO|nr:NAD-dependent deacylase [Nonlabens ponticola]AZQ44043.1 NAD-dependent deacylase [Nonlabens ponticola]
MKKVVALTGAGISAESGISTFRDADGLWEGHDVMEVASPQGWAANPELVLDFYNKRRAQLKEVEPNEAHYCLAALERNCDVHIITQNVDDLHERAGSTNVIHLHGELLKARGTKDLNTVVDWVDDIAISDKATDGSQLRPHIVWFGEDVPMMDIAIDTIHDADIVIIIGTSLQVYPAAGLMHYAPSHAMTYLVDPNPCFAGNEHLKVIVQAATQGVPKVCDMITMEF